MSNSFTSCGYVISSCGQFSALYSSIKCNVFFHDQFKSYHLRLFAVSKFNVKFNPRASSKYLSLLVSLLPSLPPSISPYLSSSYTLPLPFPSPSLTVSLSLFLFLVYLTLPLRIKVCSINIYLAPCLNFLLTSFPLINVIFSSLPSFTLNSPHG